MKRKPYEPFLYLSPGILLLLVFIVIPILFLFALSFFKWDMLSGNYSFAGLENYLQMFRDPRFINAARNTLIYVAGVIPVGMGLALFIAVLVNNKMKAFAAYRTSIFIPVIVSLAAGGVIWLWLYDYRSGIINYILTQTGISRINWLGNPDTALLSVIIVTLWQRIGYNMVIFFAGLQVIPKHLYEAAKVDGAKSFSQFRYVTWPNLLPTTSFVLVINLIFAFRDFDQIYVMTRGGPMRATTTLVYHIYETAFAEFNAGMAASATMVLFVAVLIITYLYLNFLGEKT
ncbi:MAG: carbohydrate ABC transporter permease [Elusimicrobiota bacterium]